MSNLSISLVLNSLSIPDPTVLLVQTSNTSNAKYLLDCLSFFLSKRGCFAVSIINVSFLQSLLSKSIILEAFYYEYMPINTLFSISKPKPRLIYKKKFLTYNSKQILINKFINRKVVFIFFPLTLKNHLLQNAIGRFQSYITNIAANVKDVCSSYGLFIFSKTSQNMDPSDFIFQHSFNLFLFTIICLDNCDYNNNNFWFCKFCFHYIHELNILKFGITNIGNICLCQDYLNVFQDFTIIKKAVIIYTYLVISIFKLRPNDSNFLASYQQTRSHAMVLPQNSGFLLNLLFFSTFQLHKIIKVV